MATKKKTIRTSPARSFSEKRLFRTMQHSFQLVHDLRGNITDLNHLMLQSSALGIMLVCDPDGERMMHTDRSFRLFDKQRQIKHTYTVMRDLVALTKKVDDYSTANYVHLRSAAIGMMFVYSELTGLPDPIDVIFKDMVTNEAEQAWENKPANQNKLLRRKVVDGNVPAN